MLRPFKDNKKGKFILRGQMAVDLIYILRSENIIQKKFQPRSEIIDTRKQEKVAEIQEQISILEDEDIEVLNYLMEIGGERTDTMIKITLYNQTKELLLRYEGPEYKEKLEKVLSIFQEFPGKDKTVYLIQGEKVNQIIEMIKDAY